jgi:hypothetical protein
MSDTQYNDPIINQRVRQVGALKYIVNSSGNPCSKGYHSFFTHNGGLWGTLGATDERVLYDTEPYKRDEQEYHAAHSNTDPTPRWPG